MQHKLSTWLEEQRFNLRLAAAPDARHKARLLALTAPNVSNWLYGSCYVVAPRLWMPEHNFFAAIKLRLGVPQGVRATCPRCVKDESDEFGYHALSCLSGGAHTLMHNTLVNELHLLAKSASCGGAREVTCFSSDPTLRMDLSITMPGRQTQPYLLDVCVTNCLGDSAVNNKAKVGPGAAADKYESIKLNKYQAALNASFSSLLTNDRPTLIPAAFDIFGASGKTIQPIIESLSYHRAKLTSTNTALSKRITLHRINYTITKCASDIVHLNKRASDPDILAGNSDDSGIHGLFGSSAALRTTE
jgi:hypothetical protein